MSTQPLFPQLVDRVPVETVDPSFSDVIAVAEGYRLEDLERYRPSPNRFRATFQTRWISEFAAYVADHGDQHSTAIFIDPERPSAVAILDYGDNATRAHIVTTGEDPHAGHQPPVPHWHEPEWGQHLASISLTPTTVWEALTQINANTIATGQLADLLLDYPEQLRPLTEDPGLLDGTDDTRQAAAMSLEGAIHQLRNTSTHKSRDADHADDNRGNSRSLAERAILTSSPPAGIVLHAPLYECLPPLTITGRLRYDLAGDKPRVTLRIYRLAEIDRDITQIFQQQIHEALQSINAPRTTYTGRYLNKNTAP